MSGEADPAQPKAAPKAPTITSAFINKGAKTFAPKKAIRRRPAPAAAPKPTPPPASTPTPTVEATPQTQPQTQADDPAPAVEQTLPQQTDPTPLTEQEITTPLPTPAATQEPARQDAPQVEQAPPPPPAVAETSAPSPALETLPAPTPAPANENAVPRPENSVAIPTQPATHTAASPVPIAETESARSSKQSILEALEDTQTQQPPDRARLEVPDVNQTRQTGPELVDAEPLSSTQEESVTAASADAQPERTVGSVAAQAPDVIADSAANILQPTEDASQTTEIPLTRPIPAETHTETAPTTEPQNAVPENTQATQATAEPTEERMWNAVNTTGTQEEGPTASSKPRKPTGRRKRKAVTLRNMDEEEEEEARRQEPGEVENDYVPPQSKRPSAKARGKRKAADATVGEEDGTAQPPPKKKRQPRKAKAKDPTPAQPGQDVAPGVETGNGVIADNLQDIENGQSTENGENSREATRPTPSRKKKRQSTSQPNGEGEQQPKRRGRPERAPTPPSAESVKIDEDNFFMDDLARRNTRIGKLSQREKKMRGIDWEEVKQRQKEKEAEQMNSRAVHAAMERQAQEREDAVRTAQEQVRYENVDGEMRIVQGSGQVDYDAIADNMIDELVVEEDDFTNRITSRSFMRNNKRYPEEFLLPGQGKRWDIRSTQDFYDALRMFGTDFGMMTTLFEGVSRRSLKLKFTREERKQPDVIKEILQQKDTRLSNWDDYLKASGKDNEQYDRVDQIKQDLEAAEEDARRQIEEAKAEYEEERRQKRLAGFMSDEEGGENEAEAGKKKKGKKGKEKQVTFQDADVEVLEVDENDGWGAE